MDEGLGWARHGIAFVVQDVRGRYDSEGVWEPYTQEREDGAAAIAWLAEQSWCDGRVVLTGGSYAAFAAFVGALGGHPAIRGVISLVPAMGTHATAFTDSGLLNLGDHLWWWATFAEGRSERRRLVEVMLQTDGSILRQLPLIEARDRLWIRLEHWTRPLLWQESHVPAYAISETDLRGLSVPALHIGGWHDPFIRQTLHHYAVAGMDHTPRPEQSLIVGPWTHTMEFNTGAKIGERDYGPGSALPLGNRMVAWVRHILGEAPNAPDEDGAEEPRVRLFTGGREPWLNTMTWPGDRVRTAVWHACADGQLAPQSSQETGALEFCYDPLDPFPSRSQPVDQRDLLERPDAVRFVSPPLPAPLPWLGTPSVTLTAATDGQGTDWVARLLEMLPDGRALYLGHGIVDAAREMARQGRGFRPGEPHRVTIQLPPWRRPHRRRAPAVPGDYQQLLPGARPQPQHGREPLYDRRDPHRPANGLLRVRKGHHARPPDPFGRLSRSMKTPTPYEMLVDRRTGVIKRLLRQQLPETVPPALAGYGAEVADARRFGPWAVDLVAMGSAFNDREQAKRAAIGEAVERYCGNFIPRDLPTATHLDLVAAGEPALNPEALVLYAPEQYRQAGFPFVPFTDDLAVRWARARDLYTNEPTWVPASITYINYFTGPCAQEPRTNFVMYSGIAAGETREAAERSALAELIERDAVMLWWLGRGPTIGLDISDTAPLAAVLGDREGA